MVVLQLQLAILLNIIFTQDHDSSNDHAFKFFAEKSSNEKTLLFPINHPMAHQIHLDEDFACNILKSLQDIGNFVNIDESFSADNANESMQLEMIVLNLFFNSFKDISFGDNVSIKISCRPGVEKILTTWIPDEAYSERAAGENSPFNLFLIKTFPNLKMEIKNYPTLKQFLFFASQLLSPNTIQNIPNVVAEFDFSEVPDSSSHIHKYLGTILSLLNSILQSEFSKPVTILVFCSTASKNSNQREFSKSDVSDVTIIGVINMTEMTVTASSTPDASTMNKLDGICQHYNNPLNNSVIKCQKNQGDRIRRARGLEQDIKSSSKRECVLPHCATVYWNEDQRPEAITTIIIVLASLFILFVVLFNAFISIDFSKDNLFYQAQSEDQMPISNTIINTHRD